MWLGELMGQGIEAAHVFCGTDDAETTYSIGSNQVPVSIGSRNFIIVEFPNDPMDGPGYRVFSKRK